MTVEAGPSILAFCPALLAYRLMHTRQFFAAFFCFLVLLLPSARVQAQAAAPLFLSDSFKSGEIQEELPAGSDSKHVKLIQSAREVADFTLTFEFRVPADNLHLPVASILLRIQDPDQHTGGTGRLGYRIQLTGNPELLGQISDLSSRGHVARPGHRLAVAPDGRRWTDNFRAPRAYERLLHTDGWNTCSITATGPHIDVWINDQLCAVLDDADETSSSLAGSFAFELRGDTKPVSLRLRDLQFTDLGKSQKPTTPATKYQKKNRQTESAVLWHLRPNPKKPQATKYADAEHVVNSMLVTDGFQVDVVAAEPDLHQPIAFAMDHRGRIWLIEAFSYPTKQPEGQGKDRILILEDADHDGTFETKKTFIEGLNLASGIEVGHGGVWIGAAPELLFIPDVNGDDVPDGPTRVLLDGFGYQDTHETLNSFVWGPDGWLYGNQGVFNTAYVGKPGCKDSERKELRACVWRYHPTKHLFEIFAHGGSNQWGLDFNDAGHLFMTHCRSYFGGGGTTHVIRNGHFWNQTNSNYAPFISNAAPRTASKLKNYLPASARYDNGEGGAGKPGTTAVYGGHSPVGTMIYLGDNWPTIYRDRLFTHNLHGHQINHQINHRTGSAYETISAGWDLTLTPDPAFVAVDMQYGPDGAVYFTDWVDRQHCHNPHAEQWDRTNGRLYRMAWAKTYKPATTDLARLSDLGLVRLEDHVNRWYGRVAQRLLHERAAQGKLAAAAVQELHERVQNLSDAGVSLRALWTLYAIQQLTTADLAAALVHQNDILRAWAVQLGTQSGSTARLTSDQLLKLAKEDSSPHVRLAIASALPDFPLDLRWQLAETIATHPQDAADRFLPRMIWYGIADVALQDISRAMKLAATTPLDTLTDSIHWHIAKTPAGRSAFAKLIAQTEDQAAAVRLLLLFQFALKNEATLPMPEGWSQAAARFSDATLPRMAQVRDELAALFGDSTVLARLREQLANSAESLDDRRRALAILKRAGDKQSSTVYIKLLNVPELRAEAMTLLAATGDSTGAAELLQRLPAWSTAERDAALNTLTSRVNYAIPFLKQLEAGQLDKKLLSALYVRRMSDLGNQEIDALLEKVWGKVGVTDENTKALIAKLRKTYTTAPLWAFDTRDGAKIFTKNCATCHPIDGTTPLGPNLKGTAKNGLDYFLENIVDPNAVVGESFRTTLIETTNGTVVSGLLDTETETAVVLRTTEKTITIPKAEIENRRLANQSLMPTGLLDKLSETELIELLKFLTENL